MTHHRRADKPSPSRDQGEVIHDNPGASAHANPQDSCSPQIFAQACFFNMTPGKKQTDPPIGQLCPVLERAARGDFPGKYAQKD